MARGKFITFEGGEGAGKSTQTKLLRDRLAAHGVVPHVTREPGGSPFAEQIRTIILSPETAAHGPLAEALLFYAARADHLAATVRPALTRGEWVISDRFSDSTRAYQGAAGGLDAAAVATLEYLVVAGDAPDLTVLIDLEPRLGLARADARRSAGPDGADVFERRHLDFHERLRRGFLDIARAEPRRVAVVDGTLPAVAIASAVWALVAARLGPLPPAHGPA